MLTCRWPIERAAQHLAVDCDNIVDGLSEPGHEPLEHSLELFSIEQAEQAAEGIVAGQAVLELEETAQERLLRHRKGRHVGGTLAATQDGTQGNHQQFMQVMKTGIAASRVRQSFKTGNKLIHPGLLRLYAGGRNPCRPNRASTCSRVKEFRNAIPLPSETIPDEPLLHLVQNGPHLPAHSRPCLQASSLSPNGGGGVGCGRDIE